MKEEKNQIKLEKLKKSADFPGSWSVLPICDGAHRGDPLPFDSDESYIRKKESCPAPAPPVYVTLRGPP